MVSAQPALPKNGPDLRTGQAQLLGVQTQRSGPSGPTRLNRVLGIRPGVRIPACTGVRDGCEASYLLAGVGLARSEPVRCIFSVVIGGRNIFSKVLVQRQVLGTGLVVSHAHNQPPLPDPGKSLNC